MHACAMDQRLDKQCLWNKTKAVFRTRYVIPFYSLIQGGILIIFLQSLVNQEVVPSSSKLVGGFNHLEKY